MHETGLFQRATYRALATLVLLVGVSVAQAHARLVSEEPAAQSAGASPAKVLLHFSEELARKFSVFTITDAAGASVPLTPADAGDAKSLAAVPLKALARGLYTVTWTAVASDDGHKTTGTFVFSVK